MKKKTVLLVVAVAAAGSAIAWQALRPPPATKVVTAVAERVPLLRSLVKATGEIRAKEFVDIQAEVAGVITELSVREGDAVERGAVLLRLDDLQLKAEEDSARAQAEASEAEAKNAEVGVATAEANLAAERTAVIGIRVEAAQAKVSCDRAVASFKRKEELFQQKLIGDEEYEIAAAEARLAEQRLEWQQARVEQAEAALRAVASRVDAAKAVKDAACRRADAQRAMLARTTDMLGKTVIRAPLSGRITKLNVEKGERAVPGFQSNPIATLMTIADLSVIEAEIEVAESDIVHVALGATAEVEVDALRDQRFAGVVTEIGQSPIQSTNNTGQNQDGRDFKVVVRLAAPPPSLRVGFTATADIVTATRKDCLVVPLQALTAREVQVDASGAYVPPPEPKEGESERRLSAAERQQQKELEGVFVLRSGRAHFVPVSTGIIGEMDIEVLSGLAAGDDVVSGPYQVLRTLKEWDRVEIDQKRQAELSRRPVQKQR